MFACFSWTAIFASSMNIVMNSSSSAMFGRMRLIARSRSKPSTPKAFALKTSAMPPTLMRSSRRYLPKGMGFFSAAMRPSFSAPSEPKPRRKPIYLSGQARDKVKWIMGGCRELDARSIIAFF